MMWTIFLYDVIIFCMEKQKLPIGIQDFETLRSDDYLYIDKTDFIYRLAHEGKPYFLARPRRFGKSLLISTMKAYFEGRRELFEGLKIADKESDWILAKMAMKLILN